MGVPHIRASMEFDERIGRLNFDQLVSMDIIPDSMNGTFFGDHADAVLEACAKHPSLHPISIFDNVTINRFVVGQYIYGLGNGDPDPTLQHARSATTAEEYRILVDEFLEETNGEQLTKYELLAVRIMNACATGADPKDPRTATQFLKRTPLGR